MEYREWCCEDLSHASHDLHVYQDANVISDSDRVLSLKANAADSRTESPRSNGETCCHAAGSEDQR